MRLTPTEIMAAAVFTVLIVTACSSQSTPVPTPIPSPTPIPGFVAGEEDHAYQSFISYYSTIFRDCVKHNDAINMDLYPSIDRTYKGRAIYVGDGLWRFYVGIEWYDLQTEEVSYGDEVVEARSLHDRSWDNACTTIQEEWEWERRYEEFLEGQEEP